MAAKRACDVGISATGMIVLLPLFAAVAIIVLLDDGWPVFYRTTRVGRHGRPFTMYKFRTMTRDAAERGSVISGGGDARITSVGRMLRSAKLDEFPQLWNVFHGEMSLVGPRPEDPAYVALYTPAQRTVLAVRPGITGPAQLVFRNEARLLRRDHVHEDYVQRVLPGKLAIDAQYVAELSLRQDMRVLAGTLYALVARTSTRPVSRTTAGQRHEP